ncbi:MAG TPA: hypothetical protein VHY56_12055, partial [Candidatus Binataceae bacterium]|nr:hypothetical protein [Candidatus Binataceae bacterium]
SVSRAATVDFAPATFKVFTPDTSTVIGQAHFHVTEHKDGALLVRSNARYTNGDTDNEEDLLAAPLKGGLPRQLRFSHDFFNADGSPDRSDKADLVTGQASCTTNEAGHASVTSAKLDFPPDTYAGAPVVMPVRDALMAKVKRAIKFHYFTCVPGPRIVSVTAQVGPLAPWQYVQERTIQVDLQPDFGWLNVIIAPFLPAVRAWFDPSRSWYLVGVQSARYYRGPKILMVGDVAHVASSHN